MKKAIVLFWNGLKGIISAAAEWVAVILGMKDESRYGRFVRRVVGGSFAFIMLLLALSVGWSFGNRVYYRWFCDNSNDDYGDGQYISRGVTYYSYDGADGYVRTADGKTTISNILWIAKPLGTDSLVCYNDGEKRGYFDMFTGEPVIKPKYKHAWVFSDGLASVDDDGWIKFIDAKGNVAIDPKIPYIKGAEGYVFHGGHCVLHNAQRSKFGMIDKHGNWVMKAIYDRIQPIDTFYVVSKGGKQCVLTSALEVAMPYTDANLRVSADCIIAEMKDHTLRQYDLRGNLVEAFLIDGVENLMYASDELRYLKTIEIDDDGHQIGEREDTEPTPVYKTARCKRYEAASGWYGLMSPDGTLLTAPAYNEITAIGYDLYFCKKGYKCGEVLNGKGQKIR